MKNRANCHNRLTCYYVSSPSLTPFQLSERQEASSVVVLPVHLFCSNINDPYRVDNLVNAKPGKPLPGSDLGYKPRRTGRCQQGTSYMQRVLCDREGNTKLKQPQLWWRYRMKSLIELRVCHRFVDATQTTDFVEISSAN